MRNPYSAGVVRYLISGHRQLSHRGCVLITSGRGRFRAFERRVSGGWPQGAGRESFLSERVVIGLIVLVATVETVEKWHRCRSDPDFSSAGAVDRLGRTTRTV